MFFLRPASLLMLLWQMGGHPGSTPVAAQNRFHFVRGLTPSTRTGQACAALEGNVFAHAAPSLKDLRLYNGKTEVPYAITLSETAQQENDDARVLNLGLRAGRIMFDLEMPHRAYTSVTLGLSAKDFIATATVFGSDAAASKSQTDLGTFTLFDLSSQHLSHSTSIALQESSFPYLHVELAMSPAAGFPREAGALRDPSLVKSATVPPSREAQTVFTVVAETSAVSQEGRKTVAHFEVPVHVPIERISFAVAPGYKGNFSREIQVKAHADAAGKGEAEDTDEVESRDETLAGTISRVHTTEAGREISQESLGILTAIGSNMQRSAAVEVAINNGDDAALPIAAVRLEMRQRKICFDAAAAGLSPVLYYGDAALDAPIYDYAKLFRPTANPAMAKLESERPNPDYEAQDDARPFTERHPELLWIGLLGVVCILAVTAFRSAKRLH